MSSIKPRVRRHTHSGLNVLSGAEIKLATGGGLKFIPDTGVNDTRTAHELAEKTAEVKRLSAKTLELMNKLQTRDTEMRQVEALLEAARRESASLQAQLAQMNRDRHKEHEAHATPTKAASRLLTAVSASAAVREPSSDNSREASLQNELAETRAALARRSQEAADAQAALQRAPSSSSARVVSAEPSPAFGVVARLQADLQEASEELRVSRQQAAALRENVRQLQAQVTASGNAAAMRERELGMEKASLSEQLAKQRDEAERAQTRHAELREAQSALNAAQARCEDVERRLQLSMSRVAEQQSELRALRAQQSASCDGAEAARAAAAREAAARGALDAERRAMAETTLLLQRAQTCEKAAVAAEQTAVARAEAAERKEREALGLLAVHQRQMSELRERADAAAAAAVTAEADKEAGVAEAGAAAQEARARAQREAERAAQLQAELHAAHERLVETERARERAQLQSSAEAAAARAEAAAAAATCQQLTAEVEELRSQSLLQLSREERGRHELSQRLDEARGAQVALSAEVYRLREASDKADRAESARGEREALADAQAAARTERCARETAEAARDVAEAAQSEAEALVLAAQRASAAAEAARARAEAKLEEALRKARRQQTPASASSREDGDLRRQLLEAQKALAEVREVLEKKEAQFKLSSLKRHAEMHKLEQALKLSQQNEALLKKKADMLELTVLSQQKSMSKDRAKIVQDQLRERNEQLEMQAQQSRGDLHVEATRRETFAQTFRCQMESLEDKIRQLK